MADGILPCKVEVDCGYNHHEQGGRVPVLDVEVWIGKGKDGRLKILHSHYMKKMSSRLVLMSRSAHGNNTKRNVMVSEGCRILKNCSMYLSWVDVAAKVSEFVRRMEYSGYGDEFRYEVVKIAVRRIQRRLERWRKGGEFYADQRTAEEKESDKVGKKGNWYKKDGKYERVVCPTDCRL